MKNLAYFLIIALLISCGAEEQTNDPANFVNRTQELNPDDNFTKDEKSRLQQICSALKSKVSHYMGTYVETSNTMTLNLSQSTSCGSSDMTENEAKSVGLRIVNQMLYFEGGVTFQNVVTDNSDELAGLCGTSISSEDETPRFTKSGSVVEWNYALAGNDSACGENEDSLCLVKATGTLQSGSTNRYDIEKVQKFVISTKVTGNSNGVVLLREETTSCGSNETFKKSQSNSFVQ